MSYTKREDVPASVGETVVELDTGDLVAVSCSSKRVDSGMVYFPQARALDADGLARVDADGRPIQTGFKHSVPIERVEALTHDAITRECLLLVLGEPLQGLFLWTDNMITGQSIRISIAASPLVGVADAGAVL